MVDYNNESTITTAPKDINKIQLLERRAHFIDAIDYHYKNMAKGIDAAAIDVLHCRFVSLVYECQGMLKRKLSDEEYNLIMDMTKKPYTPIDDLLNQFSFINILFDKINLTKIDTRADFDMTHIEAENRVHGL
jgi:hypothetical protein